MWRRLLFWSGAALVGLALGAGTAFWALGNAASWSQQQFGPWSFNPVAGSTAADPYGRAMVARAGLLALRASETIYFNLDEDEQGRPLDEACVYELSGADLPARWWSVTIYAPDHFLPRNRDRAFSVDATRVRRDAAGAWRARISAVRGESIDWISAREARRGYSLTLRLYQPRQDARENPATIALPTLRTLSCPEAQT